MHGQILTPRRCAKVLIDLAAAIEEGLEARLSDRDGQRHADRRPDRIAAADPVPHGEAILRVHAEFIHGARIDRHGGEVLRHCLVAQTLLNPAARHACIGLRLERDEGLGADDKERARGIGLRDDIGELAAIDIRDEGHAGRALRGGPQCLDRHRRSQIRTADADIHHQ